MMPIQDLLHRIRWDREFGQSRFEIGYYDRMAKALVRVPFESIAFPSGESFFLEIAAPDGEVRRIPLHRVRAVWRNAALIWQR
jgi:uncharacterized protein (UPF0248 family)